jgi:hypothetical protein
VCSSDLLSGTLVIVYNGQVTTQTDLLLYVRHKNPGGSGRRGERIQFAVEW